MVESSNTQFLVVMADDWSSLRSSLKVYTLTDTGIAVSPDITRYAACVVQVPKWVASQASEKFRNRNFSVHYADSDVHARQIMYDLLMSPMRETSE
jgi:hypothetical protein